LSDRSAHYRDLTQGVSAHLAGLRTSTPEVMKSFGDAIAAFEEFSAAAGAHA